MAHHVAFELETLMEDIVAIVDIAVCDERVFVASTSALLVYGVGENDRLRGGASATMLYSSKTFSKKQLTKIDVDRRHKMLYSLSGEASCWRSSCVCVVHGVCTEAVVVSLFSWVVARRACR